MNFVVMELKFVADVHLGKLARLLRMLGFDTFYIKNFSSDELRKISSEEKQNSFVKEHCTSENTSSQ